MFELAFPIASLRPADYNPRSISDESLSQLEDSLKTLGIVKPVVALKDGLIVAGHQRTKAATRAGLTETPVCFLSKKPNAADEIRFNQLHNGTDLDSGDEGAWVEPGQEPGFALSPLLKGNFRSHGAATRSELAKMLTAYGNWGGCVAAMSGEILSGGSYALAAHAIHYPVRVCYVPAEHEQLVRDIFAKQYGRYDYQKIERRTYNQTFAQMFRLRGGKVDNNSPTYGWLIEAVAKTDRILDFGCGQGDYVAALKKQGYDIHGMEFYRRKGSALDIAASQRMIDVLIMNLKTKGLFDVVICDYVLNSVDSKQAENDVMACVNAFLKPGGTAFFSGRTMSRIEKSGNATKATQKARNAEFLDDNNLSGLYRAGEWFFQKFHAKDDVDAIVRSHFREDAEYEYRERTTAWQAKVTKTTQAPDIKGAINREFNLPLPNGRSFERHEQVYSVLAPLICTAN